MGLFGKTKSKMVMLVVTPHYFRGHPDSVLPFLKKVGVDLKNPEDYIKWAQGHGLRWVNQYVLILPSHHAKKLMKLNTKKKVFLNVDVNWGAEGYIRRSYPELFEEQKAFIKPN